MTETATICLSTSALSKVTFTAKRQLTIATVDEWLALSDSNTTIHTSISMYTVYSSYVTTWDFDH